MTISAVHASDLPGKPIVVTHHEAPFSQTLELSGESGDLLDARVTVRDVAVASQDAGGAGAIAGAVRHIGGGSAFGASLCVGG